MSDLEEAARLLSELEQYKNTHRLLYYKPYDFQLDFHNAIGFKTDKPAEERFLMCANQIGKTFSGAREDAFHLTGLYPSWYKGVRFNHPVILIAAGKTNDSTKNVVQIELFGDPIDESKFGTGSIPKDRIGKITRKAGVPNAYSEVQVKHSTNGIEDGWSRCILMSFEMKETAFMGYKVDVAHPDEEPPSPIMQQMRRSVLSTGGIIYVTFTPEEGMTEVVTEVIDNLKEGQALIRASWDDAPHMTPSEREKVLNRFPVHEREMRSKGEPMIGSGRIFYPIDETYTIDPFEIPAHFARINGIDFGWDHPFACANIAVDRESDTVYLYDGYRESRALPTIHAASVKKHGDWIPCAWPHDGMKSDPQSGRIIADIYRDHGVNMWPVPFTNPPPPNMEEGKGGNGVEAGITQILEMMETNRFKVFRTVKYWFEEAGRYHRKYVNNKSQIVALNDDFISAVRYAVMFRRFATTRTIRQKHRQTQQGLTNW